MKFKQEHLPETVRQTKERVLKSLKQELTEKLNQKRIKRISKKYRMVKFFGECLRKRTVEADRTLNSYRKKKSVKKIEDKNSIM